MRDGPNCIPNPGLTLPMLDAHPSVNVFILYKKGVCGANFYALMNKLKIFKKKYFEVILYMLIIIV